MNTTPTKEDVARGFQPPGANLPATQAAGNKVLDNRDPVAAMLEGQRGALAMALPKHVTPDHFLRIALTTIKRTPKLLEADRKSLLGALMTAAQLGLEPDGVLGHAYLVPFSVKNRDTNTWTTQVQFIPGYKGFIQLARNSGEIQSIQVKEVRKGDNFKYSYGFTETLEHVPVSGVDQPLTHVWMVVNFTNGGRHWDVMTRDQIERVMKLSQSYQRAEKGYQDKPPKRDSTWHLHFDAMAIKTIIRKNAKFLPMSVQKAAAIDEAVEVGNLGTLVEGTVVIEGDAAPASDDIDTAQGEPEARDDGAGVASNKKTEEKPAASAQPAAAAGEQAQGAHNPAPTAAGAPADPAKGTAGGSPAAEALPKKRGRPARKAENPPQEQAKPAEPTQPEIDPYEVFIVKDGTEPDVYASMVKKRFDDCVEPDGDHVKKMFAAVDWAWLEDKASTAAYNAAVLALENAAQKTGVDLDAVDNDGSADDGGEQGQSDDPPPVDPSDYGEQPTQPAKPTAAAKTDPGPIPFKTQLWVSPGSKWAPRFLDELAKCKHPEHIEACVRAHHNSLMQIERFDPPIHDKIKKAVAEARAAAKGA